MTSCGQHATRIFSSPRTPPAASVMRRSRGIFASYDDRIEREREAFIANAEAAWTREPTSSLEIFICMQRADHRRPGDDTCLCPPRALRRSAEPRGHAHAQTQETETRVLRTGLATVAALPKVWVDMRWGCVCGPRYHYRVQPEPEWHPSLCTARSPPVRRARSANNGPRCTK